MAEFIVGAGFGSLASVGLEKLIKEAKNVLAFKPVSKELASTMDDLRPMIINIEVFRKPVELKSLKDLIDKAEVLVKRCSGVKRWEVLEKAKCTKKVRKIQKEMVSFCLYQLQFLQFTNQLQCAGYIEKLFIMMKDIDDNLENITNKIDLLREDLMKKLEKMDRMLISIKEDISSVSNRGKAFLEIDWPQIQPKKKVLDDSVDSLLQVFPSLASLGCGKTKLVTQMQPKKEVLDDFMVCQKEVKKEGKNGALVSEALKHVIEEAKKFKAYKPLSNDLVQMMEELLPITEKIDELGLSGEELNGLKDTIERASVMVHKFPSVRFYEKPKYTREIEGIKKDILKFSQINLQVLQPNNQSTLLDLTDNLMKKVDGLSKRIEDLTLQAPAFMDFCSVPKLRKVPIGLDRPLMELKKRLLDDDVGNLVVSAPLGCGKTTLVTLLCHDEDIERKFKHIFFNVVSSAPNFRKLVQNLLQHNGHAPPPFENDNQVINGLQTMLKDLKEDGPILMVLDDVWHGAESLLEKFKSNDLHGYKVLVTSRVEFLNFGPTLKLKPLNDEDARTLLIQWASRPRNASEDEYNDVLKFCNGFPLVIEVVGGSLKGRSLTSWKGQLESWSEGKKNIVQESLQLSFNALESHLKECFLDLGLFRETQKIRASIIIDIWVELYDKGINPCIKYLEDLASLNLLELVPLGRKENEDGFYNEFLVTQHDNLRELAIRQSESEAVFKRKRVNLEIKGNNFPDCPIINASLLSISTDDSFSSKWVEMDCPNVEALILNIRSSNYELPKFISTMKKLKIVIIINHGSYPARLNNLSCLSSLPNLKHIKLEKVSDCDAAV